MNRASVAAAIDSPPQLIGLYERHERFPGKQKFTAIVRLAEVRGVELLACDFIKTAKPKKHANHKSV